MAYGEYMKQYVFEPLGMHNTGYSIDDKTSERIAFPSTPPGSTGVPHTSSCFSSGRLHSTVEDLYEWDLAIRNFKLVNEENTKKMFTPFINSYAYGWFVMANNHFHNGGGPNGYAAHITSNKDTDITIIVLTNSPENGFSVIPVKLKQFLNEF